MRIIKENDVYLKILTHDKGIKQTISEYFSFLVPNHIHLPKVKSGQWDGRIRLYNKATNRLYAGLFHRLLKYLSKMDLVPEHIDPALFNNVSDFTEEELLQNISKMSFFYKGKQLFPHDYQIRPVVDLLVNKRGLLLSPVSSGKSLILYIIIRLLQKKFKTSSKKTLLVVPSIILTTQMRADFEEYSAHDPEWNVNDHVHIISGGKEKTASQGIYVSTWQSISKLPKAYFTQFDRVLVDEAHLAKSTEITTILENLDNCPYRIGTTGSLDDAIANKLVLEGLFGKIFSYVTTKELMDAKKVSSLKIHCIALKYNDEDRKLVSKMDYFEEIDFLIGHRRRNDIIHAVSMAQKKNTIILYGRVDSHAKIMYERLKKTHSGPVYLITRKTPPAEREIIRNSISKDSNARIVATYAIMSTGVSIPALEIMIFAHPFKGTIRTIQSIGRVLRLSEGKGGGVLYDIFDDLQWKSKINHTLDHFIIRSDTYHKQKFDYQIHERTL